MFVISGSGGLSRRKIILPGFGEGLETYAFIDNLKRAEAYKFHSFVVHAVR